MNESSFGIKYITKKASDNVNAIIVDAQYSTGSHIVFEYTPTLNVYDAYLDMFSFEIPNTPGLSFELRCNRGTSLFTLFRVDSNTNLLNTARVINFESFLLPSGSTIRLVYTVTTSIALIRACLSYREVAIV